MAKSMGISAGSADGNGGGIGGGGGATERKAALLSKLVGHPKSVPTGPPHAAHAPEGSEHAAASAVGIVASKLAEVAGQTYFQRVLKTECTALFMLSSWTSMSDSDFCAVSIALQPDEEMLTKSGRRKAAYKQPMGLYAFAPVVLDCRSTVTYPSIARGKMVDRKCQYKRIAVHRAAWTWMRLAPEWGGGVPRPLVPSLENGTLLVLFLTLFH